MKFFIDSANVETIQKAAAFGMADGVTTNPTLLAKEKAHPSEIYKNICKIIKGPVCVEAVSLSAQEIIAESQELAKIAENIVIKIPAIKEGLIAVHQLEQDGIRTNVTLVFSPVQALVAAKAGASYICPFVGRLDDVSHTGMALIEQILEIYSNYDFPTEVIVASIRSVLHVRDAALLGAHIATIPFEVIEKLIKHPLTEAGVESFLQDWNKVSSRS